MKNNTTISPSTPQKKEGRLQPSGNPVFVRTLSSWLRPSTNAVLLAVEPLRL